MRNRFINSLAKAGLMKIVVIGAVYLGAEIYKKVRQSQEDDLNEENNVEVKKPEGSVNHKPMSQADAYVNAEKDKKVTAVAPKKASLKDFSKERAEKKEVKSTPASKEKNVENNEVPTEKKPAAKRTPVKRTLAKPKTAAPKSTDKKTDDKGKK